MPLFSTSQGLVYFAHVPKCAGTAVTSALKRRFGRSSAMYDSGYRSVEPELRWNRSSPQHIEAASLAKILPEHIFLLGFSVVRHPVLRLHSAYLYNRDIEELIDPAEDFTTWLHSLSRRRRENPWYLDNHARPISEMVPEFCNVFRIEDGLDRVTAWLDEMLGPSASSSEIRVMHTLGERMEVKEKKPLGALAKPTTEDIAIIADMDHVDFERFHYPPNPKDVNAAVPLPPKRTV